MKHVDMYLLNTKRQIDAGTVKLVRLKSKYFILSESYRIEKDKDLYICLPKGSLAKKYLPEINKIIKTKNLLNSDLYDTKRVTITKRPDLGEESVSAENKLYDSALDAYRDGNYKEAIVGFKSFLNGYPGSSLADNAQVWIADSYMSQSQYEKAILAYQEVIKNYPERNKVPNAMLKQALAFYEIKDTTSSKLLLKKIIKKYPDSAEAKIAEAKLRTL